MTTEVDALAAVLENEHAALYVLAVLGARTSQSAAPLVYEAMQSAYLAHRAQRDELISMLAERDATADPGATAYLVPPARTTDALARAGLEVERGCARAYSAAVAQTSGAARRWAILALNDAAARELAFRGTPEIFPGMGDVADR
ncbi:DUF4439 domain-containing protein [Nocardioides sp.]|uniref:DUF4439 domain-containing protein n=1 Tax=Nocardioides sp. TaxID=35761 RepID=UPI003568E362